MKYYAIYNNLTLELSKAQCKCLNDECVNIEITEEIYNDFDKYIYQDGEIVLNPNYEEEQKAKEQARIQELYMTRSDFFDGTIQAWGVGQDELLVLIQALLATLPIEDVKKLMAINNFKNALNFYRKHALFNMLVGIPIQLTETIQVILTDEALDKFFDEVDKGNKETAWQYLPQPVAIETEEVIDDTNNSTTTNNTDVPVQPQIEDGLQEGETTDS